MILINQVFSIGTSKVDGATMNGDSIDLNELLKIKFSSESNLLNLIFEIINSIFFGY